MSKTSRRIMGIGTALMACSAIMASPAFAADNSDTVTKAEFKAELTGADLTKWNTLSADEQSRAIAAINAVADTNDLPATDAEAKGIAPELSVSSSTSTVTSPSTNTSAATGRVSLLAASAAAAPTYDVTSNYDKKYSVLGVTYSKVTITYRYKTGSGKVLGDYSCVGKANDKIPLRDITNVTNNYVSNGKGTCIATWTVKKVDGYGGTTSSDQGMVVNGSKIEKTWGPQ